MTRDNGVKLHQDADVNSAVVTGKDRSGQIFDGLVKKGITFTVGSSPTCNGNYVWLSAAVPLVAQPASGSDYVLGYIAENGDDGAYNVDPISVYVTATSQGTPALSTPQPTAAVLYPTRQPTPSLPPPTSTLLAIGPTICPPNTLVAALPFILVPEAFYTI